jgi:hypothetical protein
LVLLEVHSSLSPRELHLIVSGEIVPNWYHKDEVELGLMNVFSESISSIETRRPGSVPNLRYPGTILIASDYAGFHREAAYETLSFILTNLERLGTWETARIKVRSTLLTDGRRMSYKALNDRVRRRALNNFLKASNVIPGLLVTVAINRRIQSVFTKDGRLALESTVPKSLFGWTPTTVERALRVTHLASLFLRGLSMSGQDVLWITDEDDIVANDGRLRSFVEAFANVSSHYLPHDLRHLRIATTRSDTGRRNLEDITAVCDLTAGSLQDILKEDAFRALLNSPSLWIPRISSNKSKLTELMDWFSDNSQPLKRLTFAVDEVGEDRKLRVSPLRFHGSNDESA